MYLRTTKQKRADGSTVTHLQIAENTWNREKKRSETRILHNCGKAEDEATLERLRRLAKSILRRVSPEDIVADDPGWTLVDAWPYGDVYVLERLWARLGIGGIIRRMAEGRRFEFDLERALFAMVANRILAPASKLYCFEQWLREDVRIEGTSSLELQHLYRAMDFLEENRDEIEREIFFSVSDLMNLDVELIFYDTTSLHFETDEEDNACEEAPGLRQRGYSKNGRGDVPQIVVGLAVTRDGFPVRHWVFPGNTVDVNTVKQVKADLKGWKLSRCLFVGDAGMVSEDNLHRLSLGGGRYIVSLPLGREKAAMEAIGRKGRYKDVAANLRVKEVMIGEGERRRRLIVCHNPEEEKRVRAHRAQVLKELEAELASMKELGAGGHTKRVCALRASRRYGKYLRTTKLGNLRIDRGRIRELEKLDGKFVVTTNDDSLSSEDVALGYKQLLRVEHAWRTMKSGLDFRPVYHRLEHRIRAHVALTVLALLLERVAEHACHDTWRNIRDDLKLQKLSLLSSPNGRVWQTTEPRPETIKRLKSLNIDKPPLILNIH